MGKQQTYKLESGIRVWRSQRVLVRVNGAETQGHAAVKCVMFCGEIAAAMCAKDVSIHSGETGVNVVVWQTENSLRRGLFLNASVWFVSMDARKRKQKNVQIVNWLSSLQKQIDMQQN